MKTLATLTLFTWAFTTHAAPTCTNATTTFTKLDGGYAQLALKEEHFTEISIYKMVFRPTRLSIWDLEKLDGTGPETLAWQEKYQRSHIGCPRCAVYEQYIKKVGALTNGTTTLCETELK